MILRLAAFSLALVLSACSIDGPGMAPVSEAWQQPQAKEGKGYLVRSGDTLYSIAWSFGLDYRAVARANELDAPYAIHPGQRLKMVTVAKGSVSQSPSRKPVSGTKGSGHWAAQKVSRWQWPTRGRIVERFSVKDGGNKGLDIGGKLGQSVMAAAGGEVVYAGDGVRGYGNLILIKHNNSYLSAYAYNRQVQVQLGDRVRRGETIATMGQNNAGHVRLHFEIRENGHPVDPARYLR